MTIAREYRHDAPDRAELERQPGITLLEFGTAWCGYCQAAQPLIEQALADSHDLHHLKIEDGKGRPLGRAFRVKLWPTLVLLRDGVEVERLVRPQRAEDIARALADARGEA